MRYIVFLIFATITIISAVQTIINQSTAVVLSACDQDLCLVPTDKAFAEAKKIAAELNEPITIRDALTDRVYKTELPKV